MTRLGRLGRLTRCHFDFEETVEETLRLYPDRKKRGSAVVASSRVARWQRRLDTSNGTCSIYS